MRKHIFRLLPKRAAAFTLIELLIVIAIIALLAALLFPVFARARESARASACLSNMKQIGTALTLYIQDYDETYPMNRLPDETHPLEGCVQDTPYPVGSLETSRLNWRRSVQPYLKNTFVMRCSSNTYTEFNFPPGDITNQYYAPKDYLPLSYAYNGAFFHEAVPACWYGEKLERPRTVSEISQSANLILVLESRSPLPDLGNWMLTFHNNSGQGAFQSHNGMSNFVFADLHAKRVKMAETCRAKMWTDTFPDRSHACDDLTGLPDEYR